MKYLIIYLEVEHLLNFLSQEEKGDLLDILIKYAKDEIQPKIDNKNVLNVFNFLKSKLDVQFAKSKAKSEIAKLNGSKGGRPIKKPKKTKPKAKKPSGLLIPDFINTEAWNGFVSMRSEIKAPLTERATKLIIKDLLNFENKKEGNANLALENSIKSNWKGVFEPKIDRNNINRLGF